MIFTLSARAILMAADHGIHIEEALEYLLRRFPRSLKQYYRMAIAAALLREGLI